MASTLTYFWAPDRNENARPIDFHQFSSIVRPRRIILKGDTNREVSCRSYLEVDEGHAGPVEDAVLPLLHELDADLRVGFVRLRVGGARRDEQILEHVRVAVLSLCVTQHQQCENVPTLTMFVRS